ncbi:MAG TPA: AMP-binding protein, partial [Dongiaceae bacterium]|nr:AMP-binding protein [Dongiaceae bacterium]
MSVEGSSLKAQHLADAFAAAVERGPERPFLVFGNRRVSYGQADREVRALAAALDDAGIARGDRVATILPNRPEAVTTLLASAHLGATVVPLNPALTFPELQYQLRHADAVIAVAITAHEGRDFLEWFSELVTEVPEIRTVVAVGAEDLWFEDRVVPYTDLLGRGWHLPAPGGAPRDPESVLAVLYTSGTMGKPKGVCLAHRSLVGNAERTAAALDLGEQDVVLLAVPHFTVFGTGVILQTVTAGASLVLVERFSAGDAVRCMAAEGVTVCHGVPTTFSLLLRQGGFTSAELPRLRTGLIAGSPVSPVLVRRVREVCDVEIAYGLTETGPTVSVTGAGESAAQREQTVGRPLPGIELHLVDERGGMVPPGGAGELVLRGPWLMAGYDRMPAETRRAFTPDGFLRTGDLAALDPDGHVRIVGRRKEAIIRGGFNVHPREVEDVLRAHPAVGEVCVVGIPHEVLGEMICACIVPTEGADVRGEEILAFARGRMADYKVPDLVRAFEALPMTASGKVLRRELAQRVALDHTV